MRADVASHDRSLSGRFHAPFALLDFQVEAVARWILGRGLILTHSTGLGKSATSIAGLAALFEDRRIVTALVVCESAKVSEWVEDIASMTDLDVAVYSGSPLKRNKIARNGHEVLVGTYETFRNDLYQLRREGRRKIIEDGPLIEVIARSAAAGVAVVYDESIRIGNRSSGVYKAQDRLVRTLRKHGNALWLLGLTATPIESSPENLYNQVRLIRPDVAPRVADFERDYVRWRNPKRPGIADYKNLVNRDEPWVTPLRDVLAPAMHFKSKHDADVVERFPTMVQRVVRIDLAVDQRACYRGVDNLDGDDLGLSEEVAGDVRFGLLRQVAAYPASLLTSEAEGARSAVEHIGVDKLTEASSAKAARLVSIADQVVGVEHEKLVVFTFYGRSVLPLLARVLRAAGHTVIEHHGGLNSTQKHEALTEFRDGGPAVFLTSDAGARGVNLPEAGFLVNFELPTTHAKVVQRVNRISRMGAGGQSVCVWHFVANGTVEEAIVGLVLKRENWHQGLVAVDDDEHDTPPPELADLFRRTK